MILAASAALGIATVALGAVSVLVGLFYTRKMHRNEGETAAPEAAAAASVLKAMPFPAARAFYVIAGVFMVAGGIYILAK